MKDYKYEIIKRLENIKHRMEVDEMNCDAKEKRIKEINEEIEYLESNLA